MSRYYTLKDLCRLLQLSDRTMRRWWRRAGIPPTIPAQSAQRWSERDANKLVAAYTQYSKQKAQHETRT